MAWSYISTSPYTTAYSGTTYCTASVLLDIRITNHSTDCANEIQQVASFVGIDCAEPNMARMRAECYSNPWYRMWLFGFEQI